VQAVQGGGAVNGCGCQRDRSRGGLRGHGSTQPRLPPGRTARRSVSDSQ
jgi:hypothetical protein